jgi:hypothetical protein
MIMYIYCSSLDYNTEANMALIVDEAQKLFNKLVKVV